MRVLFPPSHLAKQALQALQQFGALLGNVGLLVGAFAQVVELRGGAVARFNFGPQVIMGPPSEGEMYL